MQFDRRELMKLLGLGGVVLGSGLPGFSLAASKGQPAQDFMFLQLSDSHWGFSGPPNPEADRTLKEAVAAVNASKEKPDFIVFTGDLTHTTDDDALRRKRMAEFKAIVADLRVPKIYYLPGEHDASLDKGQAYQENFGVLHQSFVHKGVHFIALDNVSDPKGAVGDTQIDWLKSELGKLDKDAPIVVLAHRPLFDLFPQWDWATADSAKVLSVLEPYRHLTVFYGHIHQENHRTTGNIAHHSAKSLIFPLPAPGSVPKKAAVPWDPQRPANGLGFREVEVKDRGRALTLEENDV
ncbi:MAG TPA: metallophosphoesterase, partial [Myxococcaceae bacterium]|nr:metallophosphoesterase [Myxococcaceae bacterium]